MTDFGTPGQEDLIREAIDSAFMSVFVACPGIVQSYDDAKKTCSVAPATRRPVPAADGTIGTEDVPVIQNVPVLVVGSPAVTVEFDLVRGDTVLLVFCDYSFAAWRSTGNVSDPLDARKHGPSYPVAIPWHRPRGRASDDDKASLGKAGGVRVYFKDSFVEVGKGAGLDFVAHAAKTDARLSAIETFLASHTHPVAGVTAGPAAVVASPATGAPVGTSVACNGLKTV